jgi:putative endonuclease
MSNRKNGTIYTGMTNDLERRVFEHMKKLYAGFTKRYNLTNLVYFEDTNTALSAIEREKQIKGWLRSKNIALIEAQNPEWNDLSHGWYNDL